MYPKLFRDYESRSVVNLKDVGAHVYAAHPSTEVLVAAWVIERSRSEYSKPIVWLRGDEFPPGIRALIDGGCIVCGHNAAFEAAIDHYISGPRLGWPVPELARLDCTMARAAVQALPLDLDTLCKALSLTIGKDREGHRLMLQMCKPRKPRKDEDPDGVHWLDDADRMTRLAQYCIADVWAEIEVDRALRPLQDQEWPVWLLDQVMNNRGVQIDREFIDCAEAFMARAGKRADARMKALTAGAVEKVTQLKRLKDFAKARGVIFETQEKTGRSGERYESEASDREALEDLLEGELPAAVREAFELRLEAGKSSLRKLAKFRLQAPTGRARGNLQYHAASPGRWAGRGIQLQNLVRKGVTEPGGWDQAYHDMRTMSDSTFEMAWGSPFDVVSRMMRGAVIAAPGKQLYFADFANVEARGCVWAAGQKDVLKQFADGGPLYEEMGAAIFGISVEEVIEGHKTGKAPLPRWYGKTVTLGCGYGMGWKAFQRNAKRSAGLRLEEGWCRRAVGTWRERNPAVVEFWKRLERAACRAARNPGQEIEAGAFTYRCKDRWLQCRLPSGRLIWYRRPSIEATPEDLEAYGGEVPDYRHRLHYWGVDGVTKQWAKEATWGGKLLENCIQGMCADFLRHALLGLEAARYWPVLSIHDEPISEVERGFGSVEEYVRIVSAVPSWATGFPLKATGGCGTRYAKA
jgi:DNA polymerase bacteriophage-type